MATILHALYWNEDHAVMIQAIIACPDRQRDQVQRMADYCRNLDGTELKIIPVSDKGFVAEYPENEFSCRQTHALKTVARAMNGKPFIWIEPDSPPLIAGWRKKLNNEYAKQGKKFLLSSDSLPPHDITGGIGVYPTETEWLIPGSFKSGCWDWWMVNNIPHLIGKTPLIQHTYGKYPGNGIVIPNVFPRDKSIIRKDAVIFHKDKYQGLLRNGCAENVFLHHGDLGDIISFLPIIRQLGGGKLIIGNAKDGQREIMTGKRFEAIKPLLECQPYISGVEYSDAPFGITHDTTGFRARVVSNDQWWLETNLAKVHAAHFGITDLDLSPWIYCRRSQKSEGRVVVARAERYNNPNFPWNRIARKFGNKMLFVGMPQEHAALERICGIPIEHCKTDNLLEVAEILAAAELFVTSQSCPFWIGAAIGVPLIQETCEWAPSAIIPRNNARYVRTQCDVRLLAQNL